MIHTIPVIHNFDLTTEAKGYGVCRNMLGRIRESVECTYLTVRREVYMTLDIPCQLMKKRDEDMRREGE